MIARSFQQRELYLAKLSRDLSETLVTFYTISEPLDRRFTSRKRTRTSVHLDSRSRSNIYAANTVVIRREALQTLRIATDRFSSAVPSSTRKIGN